MIRKSFAIALILVALGLVVPATVADAGAAVRSINEDGCLLVLQLEEETMRFRLKDIHVAILASDGRKVPLSVRGFEEELSAQEAAGHRLILDDSEGGHMTIFAVGTPSRSGDTPKSTYLIYGEPIN